MNVVSANEPKERVGALMQHVTDEQARWKPKAGAWSMLDVVNHLVDEEKEDFRVRLDSILLNAEQDWPPIDPEGWVVERRYNERDLQESLDHYRSERRASLEWLDACLGLVLHILPFGWC